MTSAVSLQSAAVIKKNHDSLKGYKLKIRGTGLRFVTDDVALADGKATLISFTWVIWSAIMAASWAWSTWR